MAKRIDILGLGAVAVDDFIYVEAYPPPDAKARVLRRQRYCGGLTAIALVAACVIGIDAVKRFRALRGSAASILAWLVVAAGLYGAVLR